MALKRVTPGLTDETLVTKVRRENRDLNAAFAAKPGTLFEDDVKRGDIYKRIDVKAVMWSVENILLTDKLEKPFAPEFGANLRSLLFGLETEVSEGEVTEVVTEAIGLYEPRVEVLDVTIMDMGVDKQVPRGIDNIFFYKTSAQTDADRYALTIDVTCRIINTTIDFTTQINMNRLR
jgi:phage baseplate assembly protein W